MFNVAQADRRPVTWLGLGVAMALGGQTSAEAQSNVLAPAPAQPPAAAPGSSVGSPTLKPEPGTLDHFFNGELPDAVGRSKLAVDVRLRWEHADQTGLEASDAFTVRTRFGLTTAPLYGFQGMLEGENVSVLGPNGNYNAANSNPDGAGKAVVADPPTTEVNQAWVSYSRTNGQIRLKGGRERLVLDNQRFVGDVGWRQNQQTFDGVTLENWSVPDLALSYSWVGRVNRVFGNVEGLPAGLKDFRSNSHLANVGYTACDYARLAGYTYLLDLENGAGSNNSCATYGLSLTGKARVHEQITLDYRGEFAWQTDYAGSTLDYGAPYYRLEAGATIKPAAFGVGYEVLAADHGTAVRTPLATLHAFNGWADVFLTTPDAGLRDFYASAQVTLPASIPLRFVFHQFGADRGGADFGQEFDVVISRNLGKCWSLLAKYAHYDAQDASPPAQAAPADVDKVWAQVGFIF